MYVNTHKSEGLGKTAIFDAFLIELQIIGPPWDDDGDGTSSQIIATKPPVGNCPKNQI